MKRMTSIMFAFCACCFSLVSYGQRNTVEQLNSTIKQELPLGVDRNAVIGFLQQHTIPYYDSEDVKNYKGPRTVWGSPPASEGLQVFTTDIVFTFEFDEKDKLVFYKMGKRLVGP
ncbi:MAG TPA: hypothetical protein VEI74_12945 [Candidatus Methylomirabilis sp.]|nr:hypothetical protein [Candidatus Methylomirabilis sp.]